MSNTLDTSIRKNITFDHLVEEAETLSINGTNVNRPKIEPQTSNEPSEQESVGIGSELIPLKGAGSKKNITSS